MYDPETGEIVDDPAPAPLPPMLRIGERVRLRPGAGGASSAAGDAVGRVVDARPGGAQVDWGGVVGTRWAYNDAVERLDEPAKPPPPPAEPKKPRARKGHPRKAPTPDEQAETLERQRVLAERAGVRARELVILEGLCPTGGMADDPKVIGTDRLWPWNRRSAQGALLAEVPRENGSTVRVVRRTFDGENGQGRALLRYVTIYVVFRGSNAVRRRSRGAALRTRAEAQAVYEAIGRELADWPEDDGSDMP
jgi:hypothetical protein